MTLKTYKSTYTASDGSTRFRISTTPPTNTTTASSSSGGYWTNDPVKQQNVWVGNTPVDHSSNAPKKNVYYGGGSSPAPLRTLDSATLANVRSLQSQGFDNVQIQNIVNKFSPQELSQRIAGQGGVQDVHASALLSRISQKKLQQEYESGVKAPLEDYKVKEEEFVKAIKDYEDRYIGRGLTEQEYVVAEARQQELIKQQQELNQSFATLRLTEKVEQARAKQTAIDRQLQQQKQLAGQATVQEILKSGAGTQPLTIGKLVDSKKINQDNIAGLVLQSIPQKKEADKLSPTLVSGTSFKQDISQEEFDKRIAELEKKNVLTDIALPTAKQKIKESSQYTGPITFGVKDPREVFSFSSLKKGLSTSYDVLTDVIGGAVGINIQQARPQDSILLKPYAKQEIINLSKQGLINPREVTINKLEKEILDRKVSDFYSGKLVTEIASLSVGPSVGFSSKIGMVSRAETVEEAVVPLVVGGSIRLIGPKLGAGLSKVISGVNVKIESGLDKILTSKSPVSQNLLNPRSFGNLISEEKIAKSLALSGYGIELGVLQLTPIEQKQQYIKQVGLFNVLSPIGYKVTDFGIALGKSISIRLVTPISGALRFTAKELVDPKIFEKFSRTGGGTPVETGSERIMLGKLQTGEPSKIVFEKLGVDPVKSGVGGGIRSVGGKLPNVVQPDLSYYEALKQSFFSSSLHPIALKNVGLKQRLFGGVDKFYDNLRLSIPSPSIEFAIAKKGVAISKNVPVVTQKTFTDLKTIYGYNIDTLKKALTVGKNIGPKVFAPAGKPLGELELAKIVKGGRPFKTRDLIDLFGKDFVEKKIVVPKSPVSKIDGFVSTQSRAVGTTKEAEVLLGVTRSRINLPQKEIVGFNLFGKNISIKTQPALFKRLGFADAYVDIGGELIPMNIEAVKGLDGSISSLALRDASKTSGFLGSGVPLLEGKSSNVPSLSKSTPSLNLPRVSEPGGYSQELQQVFGGKSVFSVLPVGGLSLFKTSSKPVSVQVDSSYKPSVGFSSKVSGIRVTPVVAPQKVVIRTPDRIVTGSSIIRIPDRIVTGSSIIRIPDRVTPQKPIIRIPDRTITPQKPIIRIPDRVTPQKPIIRIPDRTITPRPPPRTPDRTPDIIVPPTTGIINIPRFGFTGFGVKKKGLLDVFDVEVRKKGKFVRVASAVPRGFAKTIGKNITDETIARTFRLTRVGMKVTSDIALPRLDQYRMPLGRSSLSRVDTFVERSKYAISTPTEKRTLKQARQVKVKAKARKQRRNNNFSIRLPDNFTF